jgi:tetratricopeptide (TPR) repeat protein
MSPLAADPRQTPSPRRQVADAYERLAVVTGKPEYQQTALRLRGAGAPKPAAAAVPAASPAKGAESLAQLASRRDRAAAAFTRGQGNVGQLQQAVQQFSDLQRDLDTFVQKNPANADALALSGSVLTHLASLRRLGGDLEGARQAAQQLVALASRQLKSRPDDAAWRQLGAAQRSLGQILVEQGRNDEGTAELRKALASFESVSSRNAGNEQAARDVADAHTAIAGAMSAASAYAAAELQLMLARDAYTALAKLNPEDAALRAGLIELEMARANVQNMQRRGRAAVQSLAALQKLAAAANPDGADTYLAARVALLEAHIQPRGTPAQAFVQAEQALPELLKHSERDAVDIDQLRVSAQAWQAAGEIGRRANKAEAACRYLGLAAKRYEDFDASKRSNAIDRQRQAQVQELRKGCA